MTTWVYRDLETQEWKSVRRVSPPEIQLTEDQWWGQESENPDVREIQSPSVSRRYRDYKALAKQTRDGWEWYQTHPGTSAKSLWLRCRSGEQIQTAHGFEVVP